jgi:hypothetical protein
LHGSHVNRVRGAELFPSLHTAVNERPEHRKKRRVVTLDFRELLAPNVFLPGTAAAKPGRFFTRVLPEHTEVGNKKCQS